MKISFPFSLGQLLNNRLRRRRRDTSRPVAAQVLESRQLLSSNAVDITQLSDEFNDASTLQNWSRIEQTEGWSSNQLQTWDINQTRQGQMTLRPETSVWYQDYRGPMVFKSVAGDFVFTTSVQITDRDDVGGSDADNVPGDAQFSLAGLMVRTPRAITNPATDWQPGTMQEDGGNHGENYVFLSLGHATDGNFTFEAKSTRNSDSQLFLTPTQTNSARLRLARVGDVITSLYQLPGGEWRVMQRLHRPDMPATLQLGIVTYTNWEKANNFDPFTHNNTTLRAGVADPTPYEPFDPDLDASFDYARFVRPIVPEALQGVDLVTGATEQQLLSFLGNSAGTPPDPGARPVLNVGVNLESVVDWSSAWIFNDAFQRARPWGVRAYNPATGDTTWQSFVGQGPELSVDASGWVTDLKTWVNSEGVVYEQRATTVVFTAEANQPAGIYRAEWEGEGELAIPYVTERGTLAGGRHYALVNMPAGAHFTVDINATNPANPIRNIHLWMPDYQGQSLVGAGLGNPSDASPFHPAFLQRLDPFNTVRFMDWASTNDSDIVSWNDRRTPTAMSQADGEYQYYHTNGVALEYQIELANEIDANPWFNMPHQANDDYVRLFATMVRDTLDPQLKIYVEWSNEVWNSLFEVNHWIQDEMVRPENQGQHFFSFVGREIRRDFDIWSDVFAGQSDRLIRVVAGQQANPYILEQLLLNVGNHVDAVSASAYAGIDYNSALAFGASTTPDDLINFLEGTSIPWALARLAEHRRLADRFEDIWGKDLSLVTYESGSHVIGNPNPFGWTAAGPAAAAALHHPRMYQVYQTLLDGVRDIGVDLYNEFNFTSAASVNFFGNYGLMHRQDQPLGELPQLRAIYDHLEANRTAVAPLEVASITPVTPGLRNTSVESIDVTFTREIDPATFDWRDVMLTLDGGPNRMTRVQTVTPVSGNTFRIGNLARITNATGTYRLTVQAGGVMDRAARAGTGTQNTSWITDVSAPQSNAVSVDRSSSVWNVSLSGRDVGAAGLASFDLWVAVDGTAPRLIGRTNAGVANADGFSQATLPFRPISDGNVHSYRFYSIGRDRFGRTESAPATPADVLVSAAVLPLVVTQFDVESGAAQRSNVTSLVLTFDSADVLPLMLATIGDGNSSNDAFQLIRHGLDGQGASTVNLTGRAVVNGNSVVFDFGPKGLTSDGYYELQFDGDGNGTRESSRRFYRLKGDLNGDRRVDTQDEVVLGQFLGQVGAGHFADLNGNGVIDLTDRKSLRTLFGRTLQIGLAVDD